MSRRRDRRRMGRALQLAKSGQGLTGDNPSVGCLIFDAYDDLAGAARTGDGGRPHAEELAVQQAGDRARSGTAYVTLEPCRERSSGEPSCSERLLDAGIARVVIAIRDSHPQGAGGIQRLLASGLDVQVGLKREEAAALYRGFFERAMSGDT